MMKVILKQPTNWLSGFTNGLERLGQESKSFFRKCKNCSLCFHFYILMIFLYKMFFKMKNRLIK
ncbi:Uncharacterized protein PRO82_000090 [Candidatus Protochlamydia amoebophila]|nr:Uncharacterized protein [Candidatus Protochlamydia amoebophila]